MKKLITFCVFTIAMVLGTATIEAQTKKVDINAVAAEQTEALRQKIKFNDEQRDEVYKVFQRYTERKVKIKANPENSDQALAKLNYYRDFRLKEIFTEEQYSAYLALKNQ
ncbi:hypothetical protein [Winogradskyella aurantia]|nr:hypothetical protein [Winogradskyella aurantia]